jgi:hypothetical protein
MMVICRLGFECATLATNQKSWHRLAQTNAPLEAPGRRDRGANGMRRREWDEGDQSGVPRAGSPAARYTASIRRMFAIESAPMVGNAAPVRTALTNASS